MKKLVVCALCAAMVVPAMAVSVSADSKELVLYTWENMFPQEVLDGFEEETGIKVVYSNFDTDETMLEKLSMAKGGDYDVVVAATKAVMDLNVYSLHKDYGDLFLTTTKNAEESIFLIPRSIEYNLVMDVHGWLPRNHGDMRFRIRLGICLLRMFAQMDFRLTNLLCLIHMTPLRIVIHV